MSPREPQAWRAEQARIITDLRTPKDPFGIAAGSVRTGHNDDGIEHPAWCSPQECTVASANFAHHLSEWTVIYPGHGGEAAMFVRLFADAADVSEEPPGVEVCFMRPGQATSLEGYELRGPQARQFGNALLAHASVASGSGRGSRQVTS